MKMLAGAFALAFAALAAGSMSSAAGARACPSLAEAAALPRWPGHTLVNDTYLNAIRYRGPNGVRYARGALSTCGFVLVVERGHRTFAVRVPETDKERGVPIGSRWDYTYADYTAPDLLVALRLGDSVVYAVVRWSGGTSTPLSLYRIREGRLRLAPFRGGGSPETEIGLYGPAAGSTTIRCTANGQLVQLSSWPTAKANRYGFTETRWRLAADGFRIAASHNTVGSSDAVEAAERRTGFGGPSFGGCKIVQS